MSKPISKAKEKALVKEAIERKICGPIFGHNDSPIFRLVVGSFFTVKGLGEFQEYVDKEADKIIAEGLPPT